MNPVAHDPQQPVFEPQVEGVRPAALYEDGFKQKPVFDEVLAAQTESGPAIGQVLPTALVPHAPTPFEVAVSRVPAGLKIFVSFSYSNLKRESAPRAVVEVSVREEIVGLVSLSIVGAEGNTVLSCVGVRQLGSAGARVAAGLVVRGGRVASRSLSLVRGEAVTVGET